MEGSIIFSFFFSNLLLLIGLVFLLRYEKKVGDRLVLASLRKKLDRQLILFYKEVRGLYITVARFVLGLAYRRVIHVFLKTILETIASIYERLVRHFEHNRKQAKSLKKEKKQWKARKSSHLNIIANHQNQNALSPAEKKHKKDSALEGKK